MEMGALDQEQKMQVWRTVEPQFQESHCTGVKQSPVTFVNKAGALQTVILYIFLNLISVVYHNIRNKSPLVQNISRNLVTDMII